MAEEWQVFAGCMVLLFGGGTLGLITFRALGLGYNPAGPVDQGNPLVKGAFFFMLICLALPTVLVLIRLALTILEGISAAVNGGYKD